MNIKKMFKPLLGIFDLIRYKKISYTDEGQSNEKVEKQNNEKRSIIICLACNDPKGEFIMGAKAGLSQNITCNSEGCDAKWNNTIMGLQPLNDTAKEAFEKLPKQT